MTSIIQTPATIYRIFLCLILLTFTVGCSTFQRLPGTDQATITSQVAVGDSVKITKNDGEEVRFKVSEITDSGIGGEGQFVAYSDIGEFRSAQFSTGATVGISVMTGFILFLIVGLAVLAG